LVPQAEQPRVSPEIHERIRALETNINEVVLGKPEVVRLCVVALIAGEHILLEDVPGVGKTLLGKALARSIDGHFNRIQFTPDLLPSDIVGSSLFNAKTNEFVYRNGPIFANIVLADEINRTTPRTQSALLESMSEGQVSADGETYRLPRPFMVIATQNPFEFEGTYPLPESQLDRFLMRISVGYPNREDELRLFASHRHGEPVEQLHPVIHGDDVLRLQVAARTVTMEESIQNYLLDLVEATRALDEVHVGVSTRGALALYRAAQSMALVQGRGYVVPDDVKQLAVPVLSHRVINKNSPYGGQREMNESLIDKLVGRIAAPR
jgi:MoxR-like ATPase